MVILLPVLVLVIGAVVYCLVANAKVAELGRIAFAMGLLAFLLVGGDRVVALLSQ